ncbi:transposase [Bradyrhizobium sp. sGM-13]|uniref:transposase n=1 Tax=Bradyrhizobium sp. sGM-13 TaxID=2831781 RepID=UPI0020C0D1F1|nr:transposase [Bradyrhizobium sp. sGM-13]
MDSHTISALNRLEVVDTGRRRRWSEEEKARIVLESMSEPRLVAATARRYGLSRSLLVTWRREFAPNGAQSGAGFVRAVMAEDGPVRSVALSSQGWDPAASPMGDGGILARLRPRKVCCGSRGKVSELLAPGNKGAPGPKCKRD